jgi:tetratricopeptide (TPR) repeat protein
MVRTRLFCALLILVTQLPEPAGNRPSRSLEADYESAIDLQKQGKHLESVPFFRAAVAAQPGVASLHLDYATALHDAGIAMRRVNGKPWFVVRSSLDRSQFRREALSEVGKAIDLESSNEERAYGLFTRARMLDFIGCPLEALADLDSALVLHPNEPVVSSLRKRLHDSVVVGMRQP